MNQESRIDKGSWLGKKPESTSSTQPKVPKEFTEAYVTVSRRRGARFFNGVASVDSTELFNSALSIIKTHPELLEDSSPK
jgi:hypothetical protein